MTLEVRVLGPFDVVGVDGPVALPGRKHRRVLAALVLARGRDYPTEALADAVWDGAPPPTARKLVQLYVSQLRRALPPEIGIVTRHAGYALELDAAAIDSARFEQLAEEAARVLATGNPELALSLADQGLGLWRGDAYAGLLDADFAQAEARRLEELRVVVGEHRLEALLRLGAHERALADAVILADAAPLRERAQELAMLALYRSGRQTDALDRYAALRRRLDEDLGLEPAPGIRELQRQILQQDPSLDAPATPSEQRRGGALPVAPTPLVGRERELQLLAGLLARRDARLLVLTGAGGSGKTCLALEAARRAAASFANGVRLVELAPVRDPALVPRAIADACQLADRPDVDVVDALVAALAEQELLLVVDNAEHLRDA
ncbi:MAG: AfsR/SARP family transcriptional regulator, partial [Gaiella sp.]